MPREQKSNTGIFGQHPSVKIDVIVEPKLASTTTPNETAGEDPPNSTSNNDKATSETPSPAQPIEEFQTIEEEPMETIDIGTIAANDVDRIRTGSFRYDPIPPLPIDTTYMFQLEIVPGKDSTKFEVVRGNETGEVIQKEITIASEMSVKIISPNKAFEIIQISNPIQVVDPDRSTVWRWSVIPRKLGKHPVIVSIDILTKGMNDEIRKNSIEVFNEEVEVFVVESPVVEEAGEDGIPIWLWIALAVILLLSGLLFFFMRKKKKEQKEEKEWILSPSAAKFLEDVEDKIAKGDTETALDKLLKFFKESEQLHSELLTISADYHNYQRSYNMGLNPPPETLNRINYALVELINKLQGKLVQT